MSRHRAGIALAALPVLLACGGQGAEERLASRLDRVPVHLHVTLREMLHGPAGEQLWRDLVASPEDDDLAETIARATNAQRSEGARRLRSGTLDPRPILPAFRHRERRGADRALHAEHAALLLGTMIVLGHQDGADVPAGILVFEASRLDPEQLRPLLRPFAQAARAWAFGAASLCERAVQEAQRAEQDPDPAAIRAAVARLSERGVGDPEQAVDDLSRVRRLLAGSARACCAIRDADHRAAAEAFAPRLEDAHEIGMDEPRLGILEAWADLARGRREQARAHAGEVDPKDLGEVDRARHAMLRTVLARGEEAATDALEQLVDRRWLSLLVLEGAVDALERDGILGAVERRPGPADALAFARGEAVVLAAARRLDPLFDVPRRGHGGILGFVRRLMGG